MKKVPVTVIAVLYYSKHLIPSFLANITQKIKDIDEIILVDNSNEDLSEFKIPLVRIVYPSKNIGYGAAINLGVKIARNETIIAMNPDVTIERFDFDLATTLTKEVILSGQPIEWSTARCHPTLIFDFLRLALFNLARIFRRVNLLSEKTILKGLSGPTLVDWISGSFILTNKRTMNHIGGFDEKYFLFYEELDLCRRAESKNIFSYITPEILFRLNQGTSSATDVSKIKFIHEMHSAQRYHLKYSGEVSTRCTFFILKLYCYFVTYTLGMLNTVFQNIDFQAKQEQYKTYADAI
ncbi:MAG: glycosyltransferase [Desulfobacteraceae bacterium]|nr:glycosyltransferase [Desulfobacteraceae bacterium]